MAHCPAPEKIQAYVDRQLVGTEAALVAAHLHSCTHCQGIHDWLLLIAQSLSGCPRPEPSEDLIPLVREAVDSAPHLPRVSCNRARGLVSLYVDGELRPAEQLLLWRHVFACEQCYQQLKQTEQITEALRRQAGPVPVSADLPARIRSAVAADRARREVGVIRPARWVVSRRAIGVAAAGLATAAGLAIGLLMNPATPPTKAPRIVELPAEVALPAGESVVPEIKQPTVAGPEMAEPKPAVRPRRPRAVAIARKPARSTPTIDRAPATVRPAARTTGDSTVFVPHRETGTAPPGTSSPDLTPVGPTAPRPVTPAAPPTDTDAGPRLALTPSSPPVESAPHIRYTPIAGATEMVERDTGAVPESVLAAASREVNERAARGKTYAARPEVILK